MKKSETNAALDIQEVKSKMIVLRGQPVLLDRDVAALYGVETKHVNQAVRNNPEKFPDGYTFQLNIKEFASWRSKILTSNLPAAELSKITKGVRYAPTAFTERGLYMLATILKSPDAVRATLAIVETYAQVRAMVREMETLQTLKDGSPEQAAQLSQAGHRLASIEPIAKLSFQSPSRRGAMASSLKLGVEDHASPSLFALACGVLAIGR